MYQATSLNLTFCLLGKFNPIALRTAKTLWSFGRSECNRVNGVLNEWKIVCSEASFNSFLISFGKNDV